MNPFAVTDDSKPVIDGLEISRVAVITLAKREVVVKNKLLVAIMIERHRRRRDRQEQGRLLRLIHQPMQRIQWGRKQTAGAPQNIARHVIALLKFGDALSLNHKKHFFVEMTFR